MNQRLSQCRNCGSTVLDELGFAGEVAPFFLMRVFRLQSGFSVGTHPVIRFFRRRTAFLRRLFGTLYRPNVLVELQICSDCTFLQTKYPFPESAIKNLYEDYRSASYNLERMKYEPSYAGVVNEVGNDAREIHNRVESLTAWLGSRIESSPQMSMLDYGGADGRLLPHLSGSKYVFEVSNVVPSPGVTRVETEADLTTYAYIQLAHILEHVPYPLDLVKRLCGFLDVEGYLYIEVPEEIDPETLNRLRDPENDMAIGIHEHINRYTAQAITALLKAAGLTAVAVEREVLEMGWTKAAIIRGLGRRAPN